MTKAKNAPAPGRRSEARERLLATASRLFYTEGIRAVGVDRVMAEADVARGTFYRHFQGKDDLVCAYLEARDHDIRAGLAAARKEADTPAAFLEMVAHNIAEEMCREGFRGCPFINAAVEYPERDSSVHQAVMAYRDAFHQVLQDAFRQVGVSDFSRSTEAMVALRDGSMVAAYLGDPKTASDTWKEGVAALLTMN
ncbi:TetR family transcriptional regulator [Nocardia sp. R6R-6]|uniref:TetR family transcriptional regulator n=1 Tax=Nocardia sp. R6R-6 TaxID=3459303 RepID=UPI00403D888C